MVTAFSSLHTQPTPLVGREEELAAIVNRLTQEEPRLLTLTGPAGVGKTRLALEARDRLMDRFADGIVLVDLAPIRSADIVIPTISRTLGLDASGPQPLDKRLIAYLIDKDMLLILDNFEHVIPACGEIASLLARAPELKMLVTSRVPLRMRTEQTLRIYPLPVPDLDVPLSIDQLVQLPSIALFVERARAVCSNFTPSDRDAPLLVQLMRQLDGLPLAIELASAQMQVLPLGVITHRLEQRVQKLRWDARDLPTRHHSLEAAIAWSYELLSPEEQRLFRHLGVFAGRVSLNAIATVLGERDEDAVFDRITSLAEKSLVLPGRVDDIDSEPSFGMLETIREYAWEQLERQGEMVTAQRAHARYFLDLAERAAPELVGSEQRTWFLRLDDEIDNLRLALRGMLDRLDGDGALRLVTALGWFWFARGYHRVGRAWLDETLTAFPNAGAPLRARALNREGLILNYLGDLQQAEDVLQEADTFAQESPDLFDGVEARTYLGARDVLAGNWDAGEIRLGEELARWRTRSDRRAAFHTGYSLSHLAAAAMGRGDLVTAASCLSEAVTQHESSGDARTASIVRFRLAVVTAELEDRARAAQLVQEGLRIAVSLGDRLLLSVGVEATLIVSGDGGDPGGRATLLGGADALSQTVGLAFGILERSLGSSLTVLREQLGQDQLEAAYCEGRFLAFNDLASLALEMLGDTVYKPPVGDATARTVTPENPLTAREQEVLRLVAQGLTSKQIGEQLFLSYRTVDHHLNTTFNKLGVDTRAQAVAVATRKGLL